MKRLCIILLVVAPTKIVTDARIKPEIVAALEIIVSRRNSRRGSINALPLIRWTKNAIKAPMARGQIIMAILRNVFLIVPSLNTIITLIRLHFL